MSYMFNLVHIFAMIYVLDLIMLLIRKLPNSLTFFVFVLITLTHYAMYNGYADFFITVLGLV
jgi:hypothetical protein